MSSFNSDYDRLPYLSDPLPAAHPDRLATVATLFDMQPRPSAAPRARVLELGCGSGPTTIPMALSLPQAEIVAVDASDYQINRLQRRAEKLKIPNLASKKSICWTFRTMPANSISSSPTGCIHGLDRKFVTRYCESAGLI